MTVPPDPGRASRLALVLADLLAEAPELVAASVVTLDGLPMASLLPASMDEERVAATSAALLRLGERAAEGLGRGTLTQLFVEGDNGTAFLTTAQGHAVVVAVARPGAKTGLMMFEVRRAADAVAATLAADPLEPAPTMHSWADVATMSAHVTGPAGADPVYEPRAADRWAGQTPVLTLAPEPAAWDPERGHGVERSPLELGRQEDGPR